MSSNQVTGFRPSANGFRFTNTFGDEPVLTLALRPPWRAQWRIGRAGNGLCGGMVFAARDFFESRRPVPDTAVPPSGGTPLFRYLVRRLFAAFNLPVTVLRYPYWMLLSDTAVLQRTLTTQWTGIRASIDAGDPCPLGLVTVRSANPADLRHNHVVLAYAYRTLDGVLHLDVYDPNTPPESADDVHLDVPLTGAAMSHTINIANPVRGFFVLRYRHREPPGADAADHAP